ncbi:MAG: hypothetical protein BAJATHORv1_100027 [Candidatus Thorarchaeota archaeon]|nr:MAG: hypothetical protein BAJATHORv1_100027 [Candidatus Thorarchaeota archaeon]
MVDTEKQNDPETIKKSLDDVVEQLEQDPKGSKSWASSMSSNRERWEELKREIQKRQKELKRLVQEKKSGIIGPEEFDEKYRVLQDELTELEFQVYNMRLGTKVDA